LCVLSLCGGRGEKQGDGNGCGEPDLSAIHSILNTSGEVAIVGRGCWAPKMLTRLCTRTPIPVLTKF
jgi:hypothetical protein